MSLDVHHVGCAVRDLEQVTTFYGQLGLQRCSRVIDVPSQSARVRFVELGRGVYLELIEATQPKSPIDRYLKVGFYHLCFLVPSLEEAGVVLAEAGSVGLPAFSSEGFDGNSCQFFVTSHNTLVELAEMSPSAFAEFFDDNSHGIA